MTSHEYAEIAQAAKTFQLDQKLSLHRRRVAQSLYELAGLLTDPDYGCPAETQAVMAMYHHLLNAASQAQANSASALASSDEGDFVGGEPRMSQASHAMRISVD